jgi:hypothetical protein
MPRCAGIKRDGGQCTTIVPPPLTHCYQHDPDRAEDDQRFEGGSCPPRS